MNEKLAHIKKSSKRFSNLKDKKILQKYINNDKYILIKKTSKYSFIKSTNFRKLLFYSGLCGLFYFYSDQINFKIQNFIKRTINQPTKNYINSVLVSNEMREGGLELLDNIFKNKHAKEATVVLLNNLLKDEKIIQATKVYGVGLFNQLLREKEVQEEVKKIFVDILKSEEVKFEGIGILKYIIEKEESKDIMSQYFKVIFLRSDIIKALASVITDSAIHTMNMDLTKKKFGEFLIDVWSDPNLRWYVIKKSLNFWQPASATVKNEEDLMSKLIREEVTSIEMISNKINDKNL
jgi:hypothetical protein